MALFQILSNSKDALIVTNIKFNNFFILFLVSMKIVNIRIFVIDFSVYVQGSYFLFSIECQQFLFAFSPNIIYYRSVFVSIPFAASSSKCKKWAGVRSSDTRNALSRTLLINMMYFKLGKYLSLRQLNVNNSSYSADYSVYFYIFWAYSETCLSLLLWRE